MGTQSLDSRSSPIRTPRRAAWAAVVSLVAIAVLGPGALGVLASPSRNCPDYGAWELTFVIDPGFHEGLKSKTYSAGDPKVTSNWPGQAVTITTENGQLFDWTSTLPVDAVVVVATKSGTQTFEYSPAATGGIGLAPGNEEAQLRFVLFCGSQATASPSPSPSSSPSPSPSQEVSPSPEASASPSQQVGGAVGTPRITPPPTDGGTAPVSSPSSDAWRLALLLLAGIVAGALLLTPIPSRSRR